MSDDATSVRRELDRIRDRMEADSTYFDALEWYMESVIESGSYTGREDDEFTFTVECPECGEKRAYDYTSHVGILIALGAALQRDSARARDDAGTATPWRDGELTLPAPTEND